MTFNPTTGVLALPGTVVLARFIAPGGGTSTTSGVFVAVANLLDSTPIGGNGADLVVIVAQNHQNGAAGVGTSLGIALDGGAVTGAQNQPSPATANAPFSIVAVAVFPNVSAGAHTVQAYWLTLSGTVFAQAGRQFMVVLEIRH